MHPFDGLSDEEIEGTIGGFNPYFSSGDDDDDQFDSDYGDPPDGDELDGPDDF